MSELSYLSPTPCAAGSRARQGIGARSTTRRPVAKFSSAKVSAAIAKQKAARIKKRRDAMRVTLVESQMFCCDPCAEEARGWDLVIGCAAHLPLPKRPRDRVLDIALKRACCDHCGDNLEDLNVHPRKLSTTLKHPEVERCVLAAAYAVLKRDRLEANFQHGHWWVTDSVADAHWSVLDAASGPSIHGFDFEQVTGDAAAR